MGGIHTNYAREGLRGLAFGRSPTLQLGSAINLSHFCGESSLSMSRRIAASQPERCPERQIDAFASPATQLCILCGYPTSFRLPKDITYIICFCAETAGSQSVDA